MGRFKEPEEGSDPLRDGLEEDEDLLGRFDLPLPLVGGGGSDHRTAGGEARRDRALGREARRLPRRERRDHEAQRTDRPDGVERVRAHAPAPVRTGVGPEKSRATRPRVARSTTAARAGTGEMLRIRWYSVSACHVDAFRSRTPR